MTTQMSDLVVVDDDTWVLVASDGEGLFGGYVVDFILVHYRDWYFPAFNVADISLFIGASLWILLMLITYLREKKAAV